MFSEDIQRKKLPEIVCLPDIILHSFTPDKHEHGRRNNWDTFFFLNQFKLSSQEFKALCRIILVKRDNPAK